jgi:outer membrane protein OmpA-like peptidoglycan-associated protein
MTVYAYLLFKAVQPSDIGVDWRGKQNPRVAKPGREPENRRVEIVMP